MILLKALKRYSDFRGRAERTEFWAFWLLYPLLASLGGIGLGLADGLRGASPGSTAPILWAIGILLFVPALAVSVRRLHDIGRTGGWLLLGLVPGGLAVLLVFFCQDGAATTNRFGPPEPTADARDGALAA